MCFYSEIKMLTMLPWIYVSSESSKLTPSHTGVERTGTAIGATA